MAITFGFYKAFADGLGEEAHDFENDTFKLALLNGHTVDLAADSTYADVSADEVSDASYTAGGNAIGNVAITNGYVLGDDVVFTALDIAAFDGAVIYNDTNGDKLVCYIDLDGTQAANVEDFTFHWHANGIFLIGA